MKCIIRSNTFETNSSSTHSLVYSKSGLRPSELRTNIHGEIEIRLGEFGKEYTMHNDQYTKLQYLMTLAWYLCSGTLESFYDNWNYYTINKIVCKYADATKIKIVGDPEEDAYIDHQSQPYYGDIEIVNVYDEDELINYIFNEDIYLKTDCD